MPTALTALLDGVRGSRGVFKHLAIVENALKRDAQGDFLFDLTSDQLGVMQKQLEGVLDAEPPAGLVQLREVIREAIRMRRKAEARFPLSSFFVEHKLEVSDGAPTDFERLHADWMTPAPTRD